MLKIRIEKETHFQMLHVGNCKMQPHLNNVIYITILAFKYRCIRFVVVVIVLVVKVVVVLVVVVVILVVTAAAVVVVVVAAAVTVVVVLVK
jgi:hypothetical protein